MLSLSIYYIVGYFVRAVNSDSVEGEKFVYYLGFLMNSSTKTTRKIIKINWSCAFKHNLLISQINTNFFLGRYYHEQLKALLFFINCCLVFCFPFVIIILWSDIPNPHNAIFCFQWFICIYNIHNIKYFLKIGLTVAIATYSQCLLFSEYFKYQLQKFLNCSWPF